MVLRRSEIDGTQKLPPAVAMAWPSFSVPFKNPTLRWGSTRLMRCQLVSGLHDLIHRRPSSASPPPFPTSHQTKNDPSPSSRRPRVVICVSCRTQPEDLERDRPPAPEEWRDHRQAGGVAPLKIDRPVAGPLTRSLRSKASPQGKEKTGNEVRPAEFRISLSKEEIIEDFIAMTVAKPSRRPTQRSRPLQKKLDRIFPGLDLPKIVTAYLYRVA